MMISARMLYEVHNFVGLSANKDILKRLIQLGLADDNNKLWDGAVRSM